MSAEGLQCGVDSGVCTQDGLFLIGKGFIFVELRKWRRVSSHIVLAVFHSLWHTTVTIIIVRGNEEVFHSRSGRSWGAWRARWSGVTFRALMKRYFFKHNFCCASGGNKKWSPDRDISTTRCKIAMKFELDTYDPPKLIPNDFGDP